MLKLNTKIPNVISVLLLSISSQIYSQNAEVLNLKGPYFGQQRPGKVAEIFAPGIISTELHVIMPLPLVQTLKRCVSE